MEVFKVNIEKSMKAFSLYHKEKKELEKTKLRKKQERIKSKIEKIKKSQKFKETKKQTVIEEKNNFESWRSSMKNKLILTTIMLIGILTMCSSVFAADLVISTAAELATFSANVKAGTTYAGQTVELANDIALSGAFTPIGTSSYAFAGTFDGKGYTISGLSISVSTTYNGLFGKTASTATIKNVTVSGSVKGANYTGGLVGYNMGNIDNCINKCTVTNYNTSTNYLGGIAGYTEAGTISNCINNGTITGYRRVGGIVGYKLTGVVTDCRNETATGATTAATVKGSYSSTGTTNYAAIGGIVGHNANGAITNCYNKMAVSGTATNTHSVGGIVGYNEGTSPITNCHNVADILGYYYYIGGVVGLNNSSASPITNCSSKGTIKGGTNPVCIGGIAGQSYSGLKDVSNEGNVTGGGSGTYTGGIVGYVVAGGINNANSIGTVTGGTGGSTGGVVGYLADGGIQKATNVGNIVGSSGKYIGGIAGRAYGGISEASSEGNVGGANSTGGIVGHLYTGDVSDCSNIGTITGTSTAQYVGGIVGRLVAGGIANCTNDGNISGYRYVGGICGIKDSNGDITNARNESTEARTVKGSYNDSGTGNYASIAGIVGQNVGGAITDCYNNAAINGTATYTHTVGGIVGYNGATATGITNCHNEANITAYYYHIGGIVGFNNSSTAPIANCTSKGTIKGGTNPCHIAGIAGRTLSGLSDVSNEGDVTGGGSGKYTGGIAGHVNAGGIINASNIGIVTGGTGGFTGGIAGVVIAGGVETATNRGNIVGGSATYVGGIAGRIDGGISEASSEGNVGGANYTAGVVGYLVTGNVSDCSSKGTITGTSTAEYVAGVVGRLDAGSIKNCTNNGSVSGYRFVAGVCGRKNSTLEVTNLRNESTGATTVTGSYSSDTTSNYAGIAGVIGYNEGGAITDCYNNSTVKGTASYTHTVAGIVGYNGANASPITNCHNEANVTGYYYYVGGIVGFNNNANSPISNCSNKGNVTGNGSATFTGGIAGVSLAGVSSSTSEGNVTGGSYTAGVVGDMQNGNITDCSSIGTINGGAGNYVGGVIGRCVAGSIVNCTNSGSVSGQRYVGGVCGRKNSALEVTNLRNESKEVTTVTGTYTNTTQNQYAGVAGIIGYNAGGAITDCYNNANVRGTGGYCQAVGGIVGYNGETATGVTKCDNDGDVKGSAWYVAGVVGYNYSTSSDITECENTGAITSSQNANYVGGVTGLNSSNITNCSNIGSVQGYAYVGGVAGQVTGLVDYCYNTGAITGVTERIAGVAGHVGSTLKNSYNTGNITSTSGNYTGGVGGIVANSIDNCYNTGVITGYRYVGGVAGRKSAGTLTNSYSSETASVTGTYNSSTATEYAGVGGVVGYNVTGNITDCYNKGTVTGKNSYSHTIGGIVGYNVGESNITNCDNYGVISGYYYYIGGIIGFNNTATAALTDCENYANINANNAQRVGGIVGQGASTITKCYNTGTITSTGQYLGGIAGYQTGAIEELHNSGDVVGGTYAGGIAGYKSSTTTNVYNVATIKGSSYVGGLFGHNKSTATNVYNIGNVKGGSYAGGISGLNEAALTSVYNKGEVTGTSYIGGLAGNNISTITNSWNEASVSGAGERVGGIAGNSTSTISLTYNEGDVTNTGSYTGGVVGYNAGALTNVYNVGIITANINSSSGGPGGIVGRAYSGAIKYSYNAGPVKNSASATYRGGVACYSDHEKYTNVYWLDTLAASGITNKTTLTVIESKMVNELKSSDMPDLLNADQTTKVWTILAAMNNGFPIFLYQKEGLVIPITITATEPTEKQSIVTATVGDGTWNIIRYEFYKDGEKVGMMDTTEKTATLSLNTSFYYNEFSAKVTAANGDIGIVENPARVYDADIKEFKELIDFMYYGENGETYENLNINLLESFNIGNSSTDQTKPVSTNALPFAGTFDGNNNTISGIYINVTTNYTGFFGKTASTATIKNLTIEGTVKGASYTGGLVGYNLGNIENCVSNCTVTYYDSSSKYHGGLIGYSESGTIKDCKNLNTVTGYQHVGGIAGYIKAGDVINVTNNANITGTSQGYVGGISGYVGEGIDTANNTGNITGCSYTAGIAGYIISGGVKNASNTGTINGTSSGNYVAGIAGRVDAGEITDCINTGAVTGYQYVGGVCGRKSSADDVINCKNETTSSATIKGSYSNSSTGSYASIAGIVGYNEGGLIENCYNNMAISGTGGNTHTVGGIVGYNGTTATGITNCHNEGNITAYYYYIGGIVGLNNYASSPISNCSNKGNVTGNGSATCTGGIAGQSAGGISGSSSEGNVTGGTYTAGIVGYLPTGNIADCSSKGTINGGSSNYIAGIVGRCEAGSIENCTNSGSVSGQRFIGGICGRKNSTLTITNARNESEEATTVTGTYSNNTTSNLSGIAGVVGYNAGGAITDCYNNATVKGTGTYTNGVGGIVGYNTGTAPITNSHNTGNISNTYYYVGGIVGDNAGSASPITKCSNTGAVSTSGSGVYTGGIAGYTIASIDTSYNTGTISGIGRVGGITGHTETSISNVYNVGNVTGKTATQSHGPGGIVGYIKTGPFKYAYNTGTVTNSSNTAYAGSVAGYVSSVTFTNTYYLEGSNANAISNTTSTGTIAKTEVEMKTKAMATLLNDTQNPEVWTRRSSQNNGYPILLALYVPTSILMAENYDGAMVNGYIFGNSEIDARRENIKTITFVDIMENTAPASYEEMWDVSQELDETIMLYLVANGTDASGNTAYDMYICAEGEITATDCAALLCQYTNCTAINNLPQLDVTEAISMEKMFYGDNALATVDISNLITVNITTMKDMFNGCHTLTSIDVSKFNTENVIDMSGMFAECKAIQSLPLTNFKTTAVTDMSNMFNNCSAIKELKLETFDTSAVTNMEGMFAECKALEGLDLSDFVVTTSTNVTNLLKGSSKLQSVVLGPNFNNLNGTGMFEETTTLRAIILQKEITSETGAPSLAIDTGVEDVTTLYVLNKTQEGYFEKATNYNTVFGAERIKPILGLDGKESVVSLIGRDYTDIGSLVAGFKQNEATNYTQYGYAVTSENNIVKDTVGEYTYTYILTYNDSEVDRISRTVMVIVDNDAPTVVFTTNGTNAYMMNVATIVTVTDVGEAGVDEETLKYVWTESATEPTDSEFTNAFTNGEELSKDEVNGTWYLWVFASDNAGNTVKAKSESFYLDNVSPRGTVKIQGMSGKYTSSPELTVNLSTTDNLVDASKIKVALIEGTDDGISITNDEIKWQDYAETLTTEVSNTEGKKVIFVIFKDEAGNQTLYVK